MNSGMESNVVHVYNDYHIICNIMYVPICTYKFDAFTYIRWWTFPNNVTHSDTEFCLIKHIHVYTSIQVAAL